MPEGSFAQSFYGVLTAAVADFLEHGFDSEARVAQWSERLKRAAMAETIPPERMAELLRRELGALYVRLIDRGVALERHPGVGRFTLQRIRPRLRQTLDRHIAASVGLIKLNKAEAVEKTLRRFQGWATSIPAGGTEVARRAEVKADIRKALASSPFEERRIIIDQGHKLAAAIHKTIAEGGGAIAARWRHVHQSGYRGRPEHEARDGKVFLIRDSWAHKEGLAKPDRANGYTDEIDEVARLPFCRCWYVYFYQLRDLPPAMMTVKGRAALANIRMVA